MVAYMPHAGYEDEMVHEMYVEMDRLVCRATAQKRIPVVLGDWNATVGQNRQIDAEKGSMEVSDWESEMLEASC